MSPLLMVDDRPLTAQDCAIGEVIAGKYLIEGVIGRGSMGVVVRATHLGFDELVALKFIRPEMRQLGGIVSRFAREAKASVRIRNEHAVNVLDVGVADPIGPFFVMEYLEGINLEELVDSQGAFDPATAVRYVLEACEALAAAHAQGIIHRDIKPQNIFLAWQGRLELIKLLDFGISKAALRGQMFGDDLSMSEQDWVMGTPLYMSPEQLRHAPDVDERSDIWSLGAVLYELLCGQPLFSGNTQTEVCRQVMEAGRYSIRVPVAGVADELWDVIERCVAQNKSDRFSSVAELAEALLPFAPVGAVLHVERVRALLGLKPIEFMGFDEHIEDIDAEPIDEYEAEALPLLVPAHRRRTTYWVELALPVLACAVIWIGYRQWQLTRVGAERTDDAIQTVALALSRQPECPVPPTPRASVAQLPASTAASASGGVATALQPATTLLVTGAPAAAGEAPQPTASAAPTPPRPVAPPAAHPAPSPAAGSPVARRSPSPSHPVFPTARGVTARVEPAPVTPVAAASASAGARVDGASDARSAAARRAQKPRPEPKLEFRLIGEEPTAGFDLVPDGSGQRGPLPVRSP